MPERKITPYKCSCSDELGTYIGCKIHGQPGFDGTPVECTYCKADAVINVYTTGDFDTSTGKYTSMPTLFHYCRTHYLGQEKGLTFA